MVDMMAALMDVEKVAWKAVSMAACLVGKTVAQSVAWMAEK